MRLAMLLITAVIIGGPRSEPTIPDAPSGGPPAAVRVRIGTYDNRAVAVAYAASRYNPVRERTAERDAARRAGDGARVRELEAWGERHQATLHFQGFCRVPVADLLEPVRDGLGRIASEERLAAITPGCDLVSPGVELVDVTDRIVELYEPDARALAASKKIRAVPPVSLVDVAKAKPKD